jgi:hypothetical protein
VPRGALIMVFVIMPPSAQHDTACGMRCWPLWAAIRAATAIAPSRP